MIVKYKKELQNIYFPNPQLSEFEKVSYDIVIEYYEVFECEYCHQIVEVDLHQMCVNCGVTITHEPFAEVILQ